MANNDGKFKKGQTPWNKGLKGYMAGEKHWCFGKKRPEMTGENSACWKGGYSAYYLRSKGKILRYHKKWAKENSEKVCFAVKKRYRMKKGADGSHTLEEWLLLKSYYGNMCLCCKKTEPEIELTEDHIIPLIKGGSDSIDNIQTLCRSCNSRKHTKTINYLPIERVRVTI